MKKLFLFYLLTFSLWSQDDDIFEDALIENLADGEDFDADFAHIENGSFDTNLNSAIINNFHYWDERELYLKERRLGLLSGNETIGSVYHFSLFPKVKFDLKQFYFDLGMPLRFPIYNAYKKDLSSPGHFISPRNIEFKSLWDAQRVFRHVEIGREESDFFLRLSRTYAITLGTGTLVKDFTYNQLFDEDYLFLKTHAQFEQVRLDAMMGPMPLVKICGLNARVLPFFNSSQDFIKNINLDLTYAADFTAPNGALKLNEDKNAPFLLDDNQRLVKRQSTITQGFSLSFLANNHPLSYLFLKPYVSYAHLFFGDLNQNGAGFHLGNDANIFFSSQSPRSILNIKTESRLFGSHYLPSYFGSLYMLDRQVFNENTKSQMAALIKDYQVRWGYLFEISYYYEQAFSLSLGYENAYPMGSNFYIPDLRKLHMITSFKALEILKLYIGYEASAINEFKDVFDFNKSRGLLSYKGQLQLLPFLYFESWAKHGFGVVDRFYGENNDALSYLGEVKRLNFGLGLDLAYKF